MNADELLEAAEVALSAARMQLAAGDIDITLDLVSTAQRRITEVIELARQFYG